MSDVERSALFHDTAVQAYKIENKSDDNAKGTRYLRLAQSPVSSFENPVVDCHFTAKLTCIVNKDLVTVTANVF